MRRTSQFNGNKKYNKLIRIYFILICIFNLFPKAVLSQTTYFIRNSNIELILDGRGNLVSLTNKLTGRNYASGKPIWRLYFDNKRRKDNEVLAKDNNAVVRQEGNQIIIRYDTLKAKDETLHMTLVLKISLEENQVRFASELKNNQAYTVIRELQYPLVANCQLPEDHQLLNTHWGGQLFKDPKKQIRAANASYPPYYPPSQHFLQMDTRFGDAGASLASNCFAFVGNSEGLYFGSHDTTFQTSGHGLRLYPSKKFDFVELEAGFYKYPNILFGETWSCDANVIAPYSGTWHQTSKLYRTWVNTWWKHREEPQWVKEMKGWQRIIMKHQYGEVLFPYTDLGTRVKTVGEGVGLNTTLVHGWHNGGHDNDYPNYIADPLQGGDAVLKKQIADFQKDGGAVLWYYSGRLIDKASDFYRKNGGDKLVIRDNTGSEVNDAYRFRGPGTFTGNFDSRSFAVSEFRNPLWVYELKKMADQALAYGAKSVFYDQMGSGEQPNWDLAKEFPIPTVKTIGVKGKVLGELHDYIDKKDKNVALGIELLSDVTAMQVDYIHGRYGATEVLNPDWESKGEKPRTNNFIDWFRYTFPEVILSDRDIRDDTDIERRVNHTVLKGLRNDVEIYRCRALIDETPHYQAYLTQINQLKDRFIDLLLLGKYKDTEGVQHGSTDIEARRFDNENKTAIVLTQSHMATANTTLKIPVGYSFWESGKVGEADIKHNKSNVEVTIKKHGLVVVVFKRL
jgi:hypothetical protein